MAMEGTGDALLGISGFLQLFHAATLTKWIQLKPFKHIYLLHRDRSDLYSNLLRPYPSVFFHTTIAYSV